MKSRTLLPLLLLMPWSAVAAQETVLPRTSWGAPDLGGVWDYRTATPMRAPEEKTGDEGEGGGSVFGEPWEDSGTELTEPGRASLIFDPPDGRLPPRTEYGESIADDFWEEMGGSPEGPEDRSILERCIASALIPLESIEFNNNLQILQTPDFVVLLTEMIHEARIVPLQETRSAPPGVRFWLGESQGHYEGDTLVVETTNFHDFAHPLGTTPDMKIVESFTRRGEQLIYEWTITDPKAFEQPFSARQTLKKSPHRIYEYACHEGNRSMPLMLKGARAEEQRSEEELEEQPE
ncbi:MAG: hypothetical protein AAF690_21670 [Acidobacteriota bacterium]